MIFALVSVFLLGFECGQWWSERRQKRADDAGSELITQMFAGILETRKMVGRALVISRTHRFECRGERLSLTLEAEGDKSSLVDAA